MEGMGRWMDMERDAYELMDGWQWVDEWADGWMTEWMAGWMDMAGWSGGWVDGWLSDRWWTSEVDDNEDGWRERDGGMS